MAALLFSLTRRAVALALPPRCPACGAVADADHRFCAACWGQLRHLGAPWCAGCALPFEIDRGADAMCGACLADPPPYAGARAAVAYGAVASAVALRLKYGGRTGLAETAARLMARLVPEEATLIVPVPLHRWRLWSRGYNQAALIAAALGRATARPVAPALLRRHRATPVLRGLGPRQRARAVAGAFALDGDRAVLKGAHVVLVDDVFTTGATARACTATLLRGGAARVTLVAWARVIDDLTP